MVACKCDICGKFFIPINGKVDIIEFDQNEQYVNCCCNAGPVRSSKNYELCIECSNKFKEWVSEMKKEEMK